jgi:hypothetical protein
VEKMQPEKFQRKFVHMNGLNCISEVMQLAIDSNSSSLLELLHTVKDYIQKDMNSKNWK